jgi:Uri superfamily endonuclease
LSERRAARGEKGTYLLVLHLAAPCSLRIGRLGSHDLAAGCYMYVGSAYGSGGLAARLAYHMRRTKERPHWHIDYLRAHAELCAVWSAVGGGRHLEQAWCRALLDVRGLRMPIRGFGASDTRCLAHLFYAPAEPPPWELSAALLPPLLDHTPSAARRGLAVRRLRDAT